MIASPAFWLITVVSSVIFWLLPRALRPGFLSLVSIGYLGFLQPIGTSFLVIWSVIFFYGMRWSSGRASSLARKLTPALVIGIFLFLGFFKYFPTLIETVSGGSIALKIALPLGISYYTFRLAHYAIECNRGNIKPHSFRVFLAYITLFPIFSAGPIERFDHFLENWKESWSPDLLVEGCMRIIHGLIKKFVLIDLLVIWPLGGAFEAANLVAMLDEVEFYKVWIWLFLRFLHGYLDFSAYSDIAIGISRLFGFRIAENFKWPIMARNIAEFWAHWHMTLVSWIRAYIYMPVVGWTRNPYLATLFTFMTIGFWHGASLHWLSWGAYHAFGVIAFSAISRRINKNRRGKADFPLQRFVGIAFTLAYVSAGSAFIIAADERLPYTTPLRILGKLFCF